VTAPRVPTEHYDAAAVRFWTRATCSLFVLGVACSWLMAMWLVADWRISGRVFAAALSGFVCGVGCWLASHARADAMDPPDEVYDAVELRAWEWGGGPS
jgi:hypothetical protein